MHKYNMSLISHFYILGLTSWIWTDPLTEELKNESPSKWNSNEGFNLDHRSRCSPSRFHHFPWEELLRCRFTNAQFTTPGFYRLFCGSRECEDYKTELIILCDPYSEWGELTASYRSTGWVWEITSSRLQENYGLISRNLQNVPPL